MNITRKNKILAIILLPIFTVIAINILSLYFDRTNSSGFFFERLGILISNFEQNKDLLSSYESFPFVPFFISSISLVTGLDIIDVVFLPLSPVIGLISVYLFSSIFFRSTKLRILVSFVVAVPVFFLTAHFSEYKMAELMFLLFTFCFYKRLTCKNSIASFSLLSILLFFSTKFFGPPMEAWAIFFVFSYVILAIFSKYISKHLLRNQFSFEIPITLTTIFIVVLFFYNPKFYDGFLFLDFSTTSFISDLQEFAISIINPQSTNGEFVASYVSPPPLRLLNTAYSLIIASTLLTLPIFIYRLIKRGIPRYADALFSIALLIPFFADFLIYGLIGNISLRYLYLVLPILGLYWVSQISWRKLFPVVISLLLITACTSYLLRANCYSEEYAFSNQNNMEPLVQYLFCNTENGNHILTDHHTYGSLRAYFGSIYNDPLYFNRSLYTSERYAAILGVNNISDFDFDYLLVNIANISKPLRQGPPAWVSFDPIDAHYTKINTNPGIQKIYASREYDLFFTYR